MDIVGVSLMNVNYHLIPSWLTDNTPSSEEIIYRSVKASSDGRP